jgi:filamentous hemagglutinin family protein
MKGSLLCYTATVFVAGLFASHAAVITDGSLGAAGALPGPNFAVPASLGRLSGRNLFHSFSHFDLSNGESATFSGPGNVQNILARVTGGSVSSIDGLIRSTIPDANFFLVNPSGVVFGPDASVDVSGSFVVTTGDHVAFTDGSRFNATPESGSGSRES